MKWLVRVAMVTVLLVAVGGSGVGKVTQVNAATAKTYQTKGVVEWVYGFEQNGPGTEKMPERNDTNRGRQVSDSNSANTNSKPTRETEASVKPGESEVAHKLAISSNSVLPTNGIAAATGRQNSQLPQTGATADTLQRIIQIFGLVFLTIALILIFKRKRNSGNTNFIVR